MVVDTQPDAATACAVLPDSFGPGPLPAVIQIPGNYAITLRYRTDEQALQALLPPGLTVAEPVVSFRCRRAEGIDWADGTSHFAGAAATVDVAGADGTTLRGMHFLIGWEDDAMAVILGRGQPLAGAGRHRGHPGRGGLMALRGRGRTLLFILLGVAAMAVHLALGTWAVLAASRWAGPAAIGLAVAVVLALHLAGLRRLRARRASEHQHGDAHRDGG